MKYSVKGLLHLFPNPARRVVPAAVNTILPAVHYFASCQNHRVLGTQAVTADVLYAVPFWAPNRRSAIGEIAFENTSAPAGNARIGIYSNKSEDSAYPDALLVDSGDISIASAALKSHTPGSPVQLTRNKLYWMAFVASIGVTVRALPILGSMHLLGIPLDTIGTDPFAKYITVAHAFAALPSTYPASGAYVTGTALVPGLRYGFSS